MQAGIMEKRGRRKRDVKFYNTDDRPIAKSLVLRVRGHDLQVVSDHRKLKFNLTTSEETMKWFVGELWRGLHPLSIGDIARMLLSANLLLQKEKSSRQPVGRNPSSR